jgi:diguanylate cyclase (GGDEF)-like protein/putative nucleotidyltransferase with HDIG domain
MGELPVLDATVRRVLALCRKEDFLVAELIATLEGDAEFATNLLRFANSGYAARRMRARTIRQAVMMAGRVTIGRMALEAATWRFLERAPGNGRASVGQMHVHAVAVASCALELAQRCGAAQDVAHLGGLLHDIGKLVMPVAFGEEEMDAIAAHAPGGQARVELEQSHFGCDHALAGAMLARASNVDGPVVAAILAHHDPQAGASAETACVQVANALVGILTGIEPDPLLLINAQRVLGLDASDLDDVASHAVAFGRGPSDAPSAQPALADRLAALTRLRVTADEVTGVADRRSWSEHTRALVRTRGGAVMVCNVDRLPDPSDECGELTGDLVLSEVARILSHHGFAGRLGADQLVLFAPVAASQARTVAHAILKEVRRTFPRGRVDGCNARLSIGVALADDAHRDLGALLAVADDALHGARRSSRGRVVVAG